MSDSQKIIDIIVNGNQDLKEEFKKLFAAHEEKEMGLIRAITEKSLQNEQRIIKLEKTTKDLKRWFAIISALMVVVFSAILFILWVLW